MTVQRAPCSPATAEAMKCRYVLVQDRGRYQIMDTDTDFVAGTVEIEVSNDHGDKIASVGSLPEAIEALAAHDAAYPPEWEQQGSSRWEKMTRYGVLVVERGSGPRPWSAYRDRCSLVHAKAPIRFADAETAKISADAHLHDGYASAGSNEDGYCWLEPDDDFSSDNLGTDQRNIWVTGNNEGNVEDLTPQLQIPERDLQRIKEIAATATLKRAIGIAVADVVSGISCSFVELRSGLASDDTSLAFGRSMDRLVRLCVRAREHEFSFANAAVEHGKLVLHERFDNLPEDQGLSGSLCLRP